MSDMQSHYLNARDKGRELWFLGIFIIYLYKILYLIFDYPHKHYTFKYFEV